MLETRNVLKTLSYGLALSSAMLLGRLDAQIRVGVQAGANASYFASQVESKPGIGTMFGAVAEYRTRSALIFRGEVNWAHNYMILKNYDMASTTSSVLNYDISLYSVQIPLSVGYRLDISPQNSLVIRGGGWVRYGLDNSFGVVTSNSLNQGDTSSPTSLGLRLFEGASGSVVPSRHNQLGNYNYPKFSRVQYGLHIAADMNIGSHWQVGLRYEHATGHNFQQETSGTKKLFLRSLSGTLAYFF